VADLEVAVAHYDHRKEDVEHSGIAEGAAADRMAAGKLEAHNWGDSFVQTVERVGVVAACVAADEGTVLRWTVLLRWTMLLRAMLLRVMIALPLRTRIASLRALRTRSLRTNIRTLTLGTIITVWRTLSLRWTLMRTLRIGRTTVAVYMWVRSPTMKFTTPTLIAASDRSPRSTAAPLRLLMLRLLSVSILRFCCCWG